MYARWPASLYAYLQPSFSMLRQIRRNLITLVLFVDPLDPKTRALVRIAEAFYLHTLPIRLISVIFNIYLFSSLYRENIEDCEFTYFSKFFSIGFVLLPGKSEESRFLCQIIHHIAYEENVPKAISFVTDVCLQISTHLESYAFLLSTYSFNDIYCFWFTFLLQIYQKEPGDAPISKEAIEKLFVIEYDKSELGDLAQSVAKFQEQTLVST